MPLFDGVGAKGDYRVAGTTFLLSKFCLENHPAPSFLGYGHMNYFLYRQLPRRQLNYEIAASSFPPNFSPWYLKLQLQNELRNRKNG